MNNVFVTDNGSIVVAAFKDYVRLSCAGHNLNLVLKYVFDHLEEDNSTHSRVTKLLKECKILVSHFHTTSCHAWPTSYGCLK